MKTLVKTLAITLFIGALSSNVMASETTNYNTYANDLKSHLTSLQQTQELDQFQSLLNETKELAINAKNTLDETFIDRMDARDNTAQVHQIVYQEWRLNQLIDSLDNAASHSNLDQAKDEILFNAGNIL